MARQRRQATILSEGDAAVLRRIIDQAKKLEVKSPLFVDDTDRPDPSPDVHIVLIPDEGLPALTSGGSGTGSDSDIMPGMTECQVYEPRLNVSSEGRELIPIPGYYLLVLNLQRCKIPGGFVAVHRERFGEWVAPIQTPEIYGQTADDLSYGSSGTINLWRNGVLTDPLEVEEDVLFNFLGQPGDVILEGTFVEAKWWADLNDGLGAYRISNGNCGPIVGTGT